uniref:Ankyrin repeat protein n=1 Tax=viral metagenome TaxID=1070528 RepID=A0A6C0E7C4_9ZZZZ
MYFIHIPNGGFDAFAEFKNQYFIIFQHANDILINLNDIDRYMACVVIPLDAHVERINYCGHPSHILKCDKIILGDIYDLYDLKTILKFKLDILPNYTAQICKKGLVTLLTFIKNAGLPLQYDSKALNWVSKEGHINVLDWWKNSGLPLKYSKDALNLASLNGHVAVLDWWKNSGLPLKYSKDALNLASLGGNINVLEWWKNSGLRLKYSKDLLIWVSHKSLTNVLEWWKKSGLLLK